MQVQDNKDYTPMQIIMADAYKVHKVTANFTPALYPNSAYMAIAKLAAWGLRSPEAWQIVIAGIDSLTKKPLGEMTVPLGDTTHSVHDILVLIARMEFDYTPRNEIHADFALAITRAMMQDNSIAMDNVDMVETAMAIYRQIAPSIMNLLAEWMLVNHGKRLHIEVEMAAVIGEAMEVSLRAYLPYYIPQAMEPTFALDIRMAILNWVEHYSPQAIATPGPVNGMVMWNGVLIRTIFRDIPKAEEYILSSVNVQYHDQYKGLPQLDRDYIYFHRVLAEAESSKVAQQPV